MWAMTSGCMSGRPADNRAPSPGQLLQAPAKLLGGISDVASPSVLSVPPVLHALSPRTSAFRIRILQYVLSQHALSACGLQVTLVWDAPGAESACIPAWGPAGTAGLGCP